MWPVQFWSKKFKSSAFAFDFNPYKAWKGIRASVFSIFNRIYWNFQEMLLFSRQFEWRNQIWPNTALQCTFFTGQRTFCTVFPSFLIEIFSLVGKTVRYVRCAMQNVHCTVVLDQIWLRHSNRLKKEAFAENFNIIGQKLKRHWQMCFRACLLVSPFKTNKCKSRWFKL